MREYPKVEGNKRINSKAKPIYKAAVSEVHLFLTNEDFKITDTVCESLSVVKGMFNRILREDRDDWQAVNRRFGGVPKEEIESIATCLAELRWAIVHKKNSKISERKDKLRETNIDKYLSAYLVRIGVIKAPKAQDAMITEKVIKADTKDIEMPEKVLLSNAVVSVEKPIKEKNNQGNIHIQSNRQDEEKSKRIYAPLRIDKRIDAGKEIKEIWIYRKKHPCIGHLEMMETVTAEVNSIRNNSTYLINALYCKKCEKYYINADSLNLYASRYGLPTVRLNIVSESAGTVYQNWKEESILHILGYNVNANCALPPTQRQQILSEAMDAGVISKVEVIDFLEALISRNRYRKNFSDAVRKWKDDLAYVLDYRINRQRKVYGKLVEY